ncbi:sugar phosphate isomerase/epimerase [Klebsiella pneumoniae]|nr:sugar phosphate isomerase/epimerase [Klebsiella pneumoniae]
MNRWQQAWEQVRRVDSPALGLVLDSFHILARSDTLDACLPSRCRWRKSPLYSSPMRRI